MNKPKYRSALSYFLVALIPYTEENFDLAFHPNKFFNELERISGYKKHAFETAQWRAHKYGLIEKEGDLIKLTQKGLKIVQPFVAKKLNKNAKLMIIFDVPEGMSSARRRLRLLLRDWDFKQVQKSVWVSSYDYKNLLIKAIEELELAPYVELHECARLYPR